MFLCGEVYGVPMHAFRRFVAPVVFCGMISCEESSPPAPPPPPAPPAGPSIVVVVVDTLRADHLSTYGYTRPTSPHLDRLASEGLTFERAYAQSGWTLASFASLLTGLYPHQHLVSRDGCLVDRFGRLAPSTRTVAEALREQGYATGAWVNNTFLAPEFGLKDGFDVYSYSGATNVQHRTGPQTVAEGMQWLDSIPAEKPAFMLLHFMEPHLDYAPPADIHGTFATGPRPEALAYPKNPNPFTMLQQGELTLDADGIAYLQALYDEEILAADRALGGLVEALKARGRYDNTLLVVTADHGEEFWEHGRFEHGHDLWSELTRVPLVVRGPDVPAGKRVATVVEHVDLVAGLMARAKANLGEGPGEDIFAVAAQPPAERFAMSDNCLYGPSCVSIINSTHRLMLRHPLVMPQGVTDPTAAMAAATVQKVINVWGLDEHGYERIELPVEEQRERGRAIARVMGERRGSLEPLAATSGPVVPSFETFEMLKELGYLDRNDDQAIPQTPCR